MGEIEVSSIEGENEGEVCAQAAETSDAAVVPAEADETPVDVSEADAEEAARRARIEHEALVAVFNDVRAQSAHSKLVTPARWTEAGLVPEHLDAEAFEALVRACLAEEQEKQRAQAEAAAPKPAVRTATRAVGVPRRFDPAARAEDERRAEEAAAAQTGETIADTPAERAVDADETSFAASACAMSADAAAAAPAPAPARPVALEDDEFADEADDAFEPFELTVDGKRGLVKLVDGEPAFVPYEPGEAPVEEIDCAHVKTLQGRACWYLYAADVMTDAFAKWAFLAEEDDDAVTLATLAREESRTYPRPMPASSLKNDPFGFDDARIESAWQSAKESGACPDIEEIFASNGDCYFFSTDSLSRAYAESLAEWASVERYRNV